MPSNLDIPLFIIIGVLLFVVLILVYKYTKKTTPCPNAYICPSGSCPTHSACPSPSPNPSPSPSGPPTFFVRSVKTGNYLVKDGSLTSNKENATAFVMEKTGPINGLIFPLVDNNVLQYTLVNATSEVVLRFVLNQYLCDDCAYDVTGSAISDAAKETINDALTNDNFHVIFENNN